MIEPQPAKRKPISRRLRYEILRRDNNTCRYCGGRVPDVVLTIDHVVPAALGGNDDPSNLVAACKDCNAGKTSSSPDASLVAEVDEDAARWAAAMKHAAEQLAANKSAVDEQLKPWFDTWYIHSGPGWSYKLPSDADVVLSRYLAAGMPVNVLVEAARIALQKRDADGYFRYFQGVANNMLAELQRDASAILASAEPSIPRSCGSCGRRHADRGCWVIGYNIGYLDCSTMGTLGHPDHLVMYELSKVVDASAHAAFEAQLHPTYSARA